MEVKELNINMIGEIHRVHYNITFYIEDNMLIIEDPYGYTNCYPLNNVLYYSFKKHQ